MSLRRGLAIAVAGALVVLAYVVVSPPGPAPMRTIIAAVADPLVIPVSPSSGTHGVMGQRVFHQDARTTGAVAGRLAFRFDEPVRIVGILISVDIDGPALVEFAVGVNPGAPYGLEDVGEPDHRVFDGDWLLHVSDSNRGQASKIDESIWFGELGPELVAGDVIAVDAWLGNADDYATGVSPEVIVYYQSPGSL